MSKKRSFKLDGRIADVPEENAAYFIEKYPDAVEVKTFLVDKDTADVPLDKVDYFTKKYTNAKPLFEDEPTKDFTKQIANVQPFDMAQSVEDTTPPPANMELGIPPAPSKVKVIDQSIPEDKQAQLYSGLNENDQIAVTKAFSKMNENVVGNRKALEVFFNSYAKSRDLDPKQVREFGKRAAAQRMLDIGDEAFNSGNKAKAEQLYLSQVGDRSVTALNKLAELYAANGNQEKSKQFLEEAKRAEIDKLPQVGTGSYKQPSYFPTKLGFAGKQGETIEGDQGGKLYKDMERTPDTEETASSKYLKEIRDVVAGPSDYVGEKVFIPSGEMIKAGGEKIERGMLMGMRGKPIRGGINQLYGLVEGFLGAAGMGTLGGAAFTAALTEGQERAPKVVETALWGTNLFAPYLEKKWGFSKDMANNVGLTLDIGTAMLLHIGYKKVKGEVTKAKNLQEAFNEIDEAELKKIVDESVKKYESFGGNEIAYQESLKNELGGTVAELKELSAIEEGKAEVTPQEPIRANNLLEIPEGTNVEFTTKNGKESGVIDRLNDGTWVFENENGVTEIPVKDKTNPIETLQELGIDIVPEVPPEQVAKALADREQTGWVTETKGGKTTTYFVSLGNPMIEGSYDLVFEQNSKGGLTSRFDSSADPVFAEGRKLKLINKLLEQEGLPSRDKVNQPPVKGKVEPVQEVKPVEVVKEEVKQPIAEQPSVTDQPIVEAEQPTIESTPTEPVSEVKVVEETPQAGSGGVGGDVKQQELDAQRVNKEAGVDIYVARQVVDANGTKYTLSQINENGNTNTFVIEDANGSEIGKAQLSADGNFLENIRIDEKHRRRGLASKVYDFIELRKGIELEPSPNKQSKEAKALWDNRNLKKSVSNKANGGLLAKALGEAMSKTFADFKNKQQVLLELENKYFEQKGLSKEDFNKLNETEKAEIIKDAVKWKNDNPELVKSVEQSLKETPKAETPTPKGNTSNVGVEEGSVGVGGGKSILNSDVDLKGEVKPDWMHIDNEEKVIPISELSERDMPKSMGGMSISDALKNIENGKPTKSEGAIEVLRNVGGKYLIRDGYHRVANAIKSGVNEIKGVVKNTESVKSAIKNNKYQKAIEEGRMTATDAKKIIESAGLDVPKDITDQSLKETPQAKEPKAELPKEKAKEPIKINEDAAENEYSNNKLSEQDNLEQEPSIKAIEDKAESNDKAQLNEVINEIDNKINQATDVQVVKLESIETDEARFQNRNELNKQVVKDISENWSDANQDPIHVWKDPKNGKTYVLSGHHRYYGAKEAGRENVKIVDRSKDFTEAEAIKFAKEEANANRTMESSVERAKVLREKINRGESKEEINKFLEREGKNKTFVQNLAALNPKGKVMQMLEKFSDAGDRQTQKQIEQIADWIGEARRTINGLTDLHEVEMFDFLFDKETSKRVTTKSDFIQKVRSVVKPLEPTEPLNIARFKNKTQGESAYEEAVSSKKAEIAERQEKINAINDRFSNPQNKDYISTESSEYSTLRKIANEKISKLETERKVLQKQLEDIYREKGKYTSAPTSKGLFDDVAELPKEETKVEVVEEPTSDVGKEVEFNHAGQDRVGTIVGEEGGNYVIESEVGNRKNTYTYPKDKSTIIEDKSPSAIKAKVNKAIDSIEQSLLNNPLFKDRSGGADIAGVKGSDVVKFIMNEVRKAADTSIDLGTKLKEAFEKAKLKYADWFKDVDEAAVYNAIAEDVTKKFQENKIDPKKSVKQIIRESTQSADNKITISEKKALKEIIKREAKAAKEGAKDVADNILKALDKFKGKLTDRQVKSITRRAAAIKGSPAKARAFADYAARVIDDANYSRDLVIAKDKARKLNKIIRSKDAAKKIGGNNVDAIREFLSIRPSEVESLPEYLSIADQLEKSARKPKVDLVNETIIDNSISNQTVYDYIDNHNRYMEAEAAIKTKERFDDLVAQGILDANDSTLPYEQLKELVDAFDPEKISEDLTADQVETKLNELIKKREKTREILVKVNESLKDDLANYPTDMLTDAQRNAVEGLKTIDVSKLDDLQQIAYYRKVNNLLNNNSFSGVNELVNLSELQKEVPSRKYVGQKLKNISEGFAGLNSYGQILNRIFGLDKAAAEASKVSGIEDVRNGAASAEKITTETGDAIEKLTDELGGDKLRTVEAEIKKWTLAEMIRSFGGDVAERTVEFQRRKVNIEQQLKNLTKFIDNPKSDPKKVKIYKEQRDVLQKVYDEYVKDANSATEVYNNFNAKEPAINKIVDAQIERAELNKAETFETAEQNYDVTDLIEQENYLPSSKLQLDGTSLSAPSDAIDMFDVKLKKVNPKKAGSKNKLQVTPLGENQIFDMNFTGLMNKKFFDAAFDNKTAKSIGKVNLALNNFGTDIFGTTDNIKSVKRSVSGMVKQRRGDGIYLSPEERTTKKLIDKVANNAVAQALYGVAQLGTQYVSVGARALANTRMDFAGWRKAWNLTDHPTLSKNNIIARSQTRAGLQKRSLAEMIEKGANKKPLKGSPKYVAEQISKPLTMADDKVARQSWITYYMKFLKEEKGVDTKTADWSELLDRNDKDAASYAEHMVETTQNANDPASLAAMYRADGLFGKGVAGQVAQQVALPFNSFAHNMKMQQLNDIKKISRGGESAKEGAQSLAGNVLEQVVFNSMKVAVLQPLYKWAADELAELFGLDDPKANELKNQVKELKGDEKGTKILRNTAEDLVFGGLPTMGKNFGKRVVNTVGNLTGDKSDMLWNEKMGDAWENSDNGLFYVNEGELGIYQTTAETLTDMAELAPYIINNTKTAYKGKQNYVEQFEQKEISNKEKAAASLMMLINLGKMTGYSDQALSNINRQLKRKFDESAGMKYGREYEQTIKVKPKEFAKQSASDASFVFEEQGAAEFVKYMLKLRDQNNINTEFMINLKKENPQAHKIYLEYINKNN